MKSVRSPLLCRLFLGAMLLASVAACSDGMDFTVKQGFKTLEQAYVTEVKPAQNAEFSRCTYAQFEGRHIAQCGVSFGATQLANVGYWEIEVSGQAYSIYAMNGKALAALEHINKKISLSEANAPAVFKSGAGRTPLDVAKVSAAFK